MTVDVKVPIRYEITVGYSHMHDDTEIWTLDYAEYHSEEDWEAIKKNMSELLDKMRGFIDIKTDNEKRKTYYSVQGPKDQILNALAAEFLSVSPLGDISLKKLFALFAVKLAQAGVLDENWGKNVGLPNNHENGGVGSK